jgi:hypothetical protein
VDPLLEEKLAELEKARKVNEEKVERIGQLPIKPFSLLPDRIDAVLEFLVPTEVDGEPNPVRVAFELRWETAVGKFLDAAIAAGEEQVTRQRLLVAQAVPPKDMVPPALVIPGQP